MITLYGINNCDTIKKTKQWLAENKLEFEFYDYKKNGCSDDLAKTFLTQFAITEVINTRGTTWRKLPAEEKDSLNEQTALKLMTAQPSIIKRPIIQSETAWIIGYHEDKLKQLL